MKKMYLGIMLTVVGSLFLFGALLDHWDTENNERQEPNDIAVYQKMLLGISKQLEDVDATSLTDQTAILAEQFSVDLKTVSLTSLSLPVSYIGILLEKRTLLLESSTKLTVFQTLQNHPTTLLQLNLPMQQQDNYVIDMAMTLALYAGIILMLFFWLLPLTTRLHKLTELAAEFGTGQLSKRVNLSKFSYIDRLEKSFNKMASRIETLVADNKILAGSLSHDLRTPLACLRFGIDAAIDTPNQEKKTVYLERVSTDLTRLENMLEAFLEYASLEKSGINLVKGSINIHQLTQAVVDELLPLANDAGLTLAVMMNMNADTTIRADNHWVYRAILNVLSNALQHADSQIIVEISHSTNEALEISINDDGSGINDINNTDLFSPFSKGDESRNRNQQNYGLGLAIVHKVMEWHDGRVYVSKSTKLKGACFTLNFPLNG